MGLKSGKIVADTLVDSSGVQEIEGNHNRGLYSLSGRRRSIRLCTNCATQSNGAINVFDFL